MASASRSATSRTDGAPQQPLRAAVVGTGGISKQHLKFLSTSALVEAVAVCDLSAVSARYAATEFGVPHTYGDVGEMLETERPDVVHVLTPPQSHHGLVLASLAAGAHVICEKPVALSSVDLEVLLDAADAADLMLTESQNYRFNEPVRFLRAAIDRGELGEVRDVEVAITLPVRDPSGRFGDPNLPSPIHTLPAGVIHDFITHMTSVVLELTGALEADEVLAAWNNHGGGSLFRYDDLDALIIGHTSAGPVHVRLRFDAGTAPDRFRVRVRGSLGSGEVDLFHPFHELDVARPVGRQLSPIVNHMSNGADRARSGISNLVGKVMQRDAYEGLAIFLDRTYRALSGGHTLPVTPADLRAVSALVDELLPGGVR